MKIEKVDQISYKEFINEFYKPGIPIVFKNASKIWKANGLFTPNYFRQHFGERVTTVRDQDYTMSQIMDMVESSTEDNPAPYPCIFNIPNKLPELIPLLTPLNLNYATPNWLESSLFKRGKWGGVTELFIGGPGGKFPYVHLDYYHLHAWINQLYGTKRFTVFPKGQEELLYPKPDDPWRSDLNVFEPDYEKHPKFKEATPIHFTVDAGETLFIPAGTWHTAYSLTPTISVAFDQLNTKNYKAFMKDVWSFKRREGKKRAVLHYAYALFAGNVNRIKDTFR